MSTPFQQPPNFPPSQPPVKKKSTGKILLIVGASIIAFLVLVGGCSAVLGNSVANSDGPVAITPSSSSPTTTAPTPSSEPSAEPSTNFEDETTPSGGDIAKVGQDTWAWEDGLQAEVTSLKWVTADEYSEATESYVLQVSVRYTNKSSKTIDLDLSQIEVAYGEDGDMAEVDYYADEYGASGSLPVGKKKTGKTSFIVTKKQAESGLLIQVTPDWDHDPAIFEG